MTSAAAKPQQHRSEYEQCACRCPACFDNECESGCSNALCIEERCRDPRCRIRSGRAEIAAAETPPSALLN
jgi:hypothetical protein